MIPSNEGGCSNQSEGWLLPLSADTLPQVGRIQPVGLGFQLNPGFLSIMLPQAFGDALVFTFAGEFQPFHQ